MWGLEELELFQLKRLNLILSVLLTLLQYANILPKEKSSDNDHDEVRKVLVVVMNNDIVSNLSARNKFSLALILG